MNADVSGCYLANRSQESHHDVMLNAFLLFRSLSRSAIKKERGKPIRSSVSTSETLRSASLTLPGVLSARRTPFPTLRLFLAMISPELSPLGLAPSSPLMCWEVTAWWPGSPGRHRVPPGGVDAGGVTQLARGHDEQNRRWARDNTVKLAWWMNHVYRAEEGMVRNKQLPTGQRVLSA